MLILRFVFARFLEPWMIFMILCLSAHVQPSALLAQISFHCHSIHVLDVSELPEKDISNVVV